jgi:hypothetical protein
VNRQEIFAALAPAMHEVAVAGGAVVVQLKDLTVRERDAWRQACAQDDGSLRPDWLLHLLHLAVHDGEGQRLWATPGEVDGPDAIISALATEVLKANGLAADSQKEAAGN